jgi:hypothetical protein
MPCNVLFKSHGLHAPPHGGAADAEKLASRFPPPAGLGKRPFEFSLSSGSMGWRQGPRDFLSVRTLLHIGQVALKNDRTFDEDKGMFDTAFEFAHIARPTVRHETLHHLGVQGTDALTGPRIEFFDKMIDQQGYVLAGR